MGQSALGKIVVGISGWTYAPWKGRFYPKGLPARKELEYASRKVTGIEINGTFYRLQKPESFASWRAQTPEGFCLGVKGHRYTTHRLRLKEAEQPLRNFFASGVLALGPKLGPVLWQLPPILPFKDDRVERFIRMLPRTQGEMAAMAAQHDDFVAGKALSEAETDLPVRHAIEVRHPSFRHPEFLAMLREHRVAIVVGDSGESGWPRIFDVTADFVYLRLHGLEETYVSGYTDDALDMWAERIRSWQKGEEPKDVERLLAAAEKKPRDVYCFFDNDAKAYAPRDAMRLMGRLDLEPLEEWSE